MLKASCICLIVVTLATQFHMIDAGFDWLAFFDRWIFGSNNKITFTRSSLILEGEEAEKKFVDNEVHKVSSTTVIKAQLKQNAIDARKWIEYHRSANFIMRYIAAWAIDSLWERKMMLEQELEHAEENVDLEPFCHDRYHNHNPEETDSICHKVFQNQFFQQKGWMLDENYTYRKDCPRVSVSSLQKNERNEYRNLVYGREVRRCQAYVPSQKDPQASPSYFGVYLISHDVYLKRKQLAYFVLLNMERDKAAEKDPDAKKRRKAKLKKVLNYLAIWEEKKVKIVAYIES